MNPQSTDAPDSDQLLNGRVTNTGENYTDLVKRVEREGTVHVIVGLAVDPNTPESDLRLIQDTLIQHVYGSSPNEDNHTITRFTFIPSVSLFVNAEQLKRLLSDPVVTYITEDIPTPLTD